MKHFQKAKKYVIIGGTPLERVFNFSGYERFSHEVHFDMARHSTIGCGGKARVAFCPHSVAEMKALLSKLDGDKIPYRVVGNMSNVLPPDEELQIPLIRTKNLNGITVTDGAFVYAGVTSGALLSMCKRNGKSGVEFLYGIPCALGGALFMNAGVGGAYIGEIVNEVLVYQNGKTKLLSQKDCGYAYKHSVFMEEGGVILGASLRLKNATEEEIQKNEDVFKAKRAHLPKGKSMGCVFKNPVGLRAGELIEKSGLKGLRVGGAFVSETHANFIINDNAATAGDVKTLISLIKNAVQSQYGIRLEEEIRYIPF